nr:NAD(P)-dependent oxidoreductase [uncultured Prevotella sp.]
MSEQIEQQNNKVQPTTEETTVVTEQVAGFQVVNEGFTTREAIEEAKRCLHCKVPQCKKGCPIGNDIPDFVHELSMGNMGAAMSIINAKSNLPAICGRVCPHEKQCQGNCVLGKKGKPVQIGKLEQFVADFDTKMNLSREKLPQKTRGRVAVIGSGPAGLTVAGDLARQGFNVTIFEGQAEPGGVLMYGIPEYRLPKAVVRAEVSKIEALGVQFITNCMVGENNVTIDSLFRAGYDAIFMGTGTSVPQNMDSTPGAKLHGVSQSTYFLHNVNAYNEGALTRDMVPLRDGEKVGVIGGGNVAMDAARTAIRLGADVTVLYRKTQEEMPAIQSEYDEAVKEGVKFEWKTTVEAFLKGKNGRLGSCVLNTPEGERVEKFDRIYLAIGSRPANRIVSTTAGIEVDEKGYVKVVERPFGMTTRRGVFAGGDVVHRPQTVVLAMKAAKEVAQGIAQYVDAIKLLEEAKRIEKNGTTDVE